MRTKYARCIIGEVLDSLVNDERLSEHKMELLSKITDDILYDGKIRINHYLNCFKDCFEELNTSTNQKEQGDKK